MTFRKKLMLSTLVVGALIASAGAQAQSDKSPGSGPNPFTDCGIGAALFSETKWAAVTSNVIWDIGTTAVISATASPQTCNGKKVAALAFVGKTYDNIAEEAAKGSGEHLASVLTLMECKPSQHAAAIQRVRASMAAVVAAPGYAAGVPMAKATSVFNAVEGAANASCSA